MAGIVHFSYFYRYMEDVEHAFFRSLGLSIMEKQPDGSIVGWPRVSAKCNFKAPLYFEDEVAITLSVQRIGVKSLTLDIHFNRGDELVALGTMKTVCCHFTRGKPMESIAIPDSYLSKIEEASTDA
nr:thioesterase family protein [Stratiformator vulcanicus]